MFPPGVPPLHPGCLVTPPLAPLLGLRVAANRAPTPFIGQITPPLSGLAAPHPLPLQLSPPRLFHFPVGESTGLVRFFFPCFFLTSAPPFSLLCFWALIPLLNKRRLLPGICPLPRPPPCLSCFLPPSPPQPGQP